MHYAIRLVDMAVILAAGFGALHIRGVLDLPIVLPADLSGYYGLISVAALIFAALPTEVYRSWSGAQMPSLGKL